MVPPQLGLGLRGVAPEVNHVGGTVEVGRHLNQYAACSLVAFEGHRYFDRKRLGLDILRPEGLPTVPYSDYRVVAAIGTTELDVNKKLVQNPGY